MYYGLAMLFGEHQQEEEKKSGIVCALLIIILFPKTESTISI